MLTTTCLCDFKI